VSGSAQTAMTAPEDGLFTRALSKRSERGLCPRNFWGGSRRGAEPPSEEGAVQELVEKLKL
jgi:hypothetical protein